MLILQGFSADFPPLRIGLTPIVTEEKVSDVKLSLLVYYLNSGYMPYYPNLHTKWTCGYGILHCHISLLLQEIHRILSFLIAVLHLQTREFFVLLSLAMIQLSLQEEVIYAYGLILWYSFLCDRG